MDRGQKDSQTVEQKDRQTVAQKDRQKGKQREIKKHKKNNGIFTLIVIYFQLTNIVFLNVPALSKEIVKFLVFSTLLGDFTNPI
jgi:hypothetical protein